MKDTQIIKATNMRYPAQIQTAIELIEHHKETPKPIDKLMASFFKARRYIGSKDKGVIADTVYNVFRRQGEINYILDTLNAEQTARHQLIIFCLIENKDVTDIFSGIAYAPEKLSSAEKKMSKSNIFSILKKAPDHIKLNLPEWVCSKLKNDFESNWEDVAKSLHGRAPTDIRVNKQKTSKRQLLKNLKELGFEFEETPYSSYALRMQSRKSLFGTDAFKNGHFEVQDEGSQLIAQACGASQGLKVVDFCAGAGGKTLALTDNMRGKGTIYACDIHERRLGEMPKRLKRAGVADIVRTVLLSSETDKWVKRHKDHMDIVLIDAPCSGSGTWRRSPDALWKLSPENLKNLAETQKNILNSACRLVKEGGTLIYATCSIFKEENHQQVSKFLADHPEFELVDLFNESHPLAGQQLLQLTPYEHHTDGFFMAKMVKKGQ